jgi:hypothetical protein
MDIFLMDPEGYDMVQSSIHSHHDAWLAVVRRIAWRMRNKSIPSELIRSAGLLMSIELWFNDIADECGQALERPAFEFALSPLVCSKFVFLDISLTPLPSGTLCPVRTFPSSHD